MDSLTKFLMDYTDADNSIDGLDEHPINLKIFNQHLWVNGEAPWWIRILLKYLDDIEMKETDVLVVEERLIHPIIAIQVTNQKINDCMDGMWNVIIELFDKMVEVEWE